MVSDDLADANGGGHGETEVRADAERGGGAGGRQESGAYGMHPQDGGAVAPAFGSSEAARSAAEAEHDPVSNQRNGGAGKAVVDKTEIEAAWASRQGRWFQVW